MELKLKVEEIPRMTTRALVEQATALLTPKTLIFATSEARMLMLAVLNEIRARAAPDSDSVAAIRPPTVVETKTTGARPVSDNDMAARLIDRRFELVLERLEKLETEIGDRLQEAVRETQYVLPERAARAEKRIEMLEACVREIRDGLALIVNGRRG